MHPTKTQMAFFTDTEKKKKLLEFVWNHKRLQIAKAISKKKSKVGGITLPALKPYYIARVIK